MRNLKGFDNQYLKRQKAAGKIRDFKTQEEPKNIPSGRKVAKHFPKRSAEKDWIAWNLLYWCNEKAVQLEEEYKFCQRKFRFDWSIPSLKIAIEYEGGIFQTNSGHKTAKHYTKDTNKYNQATADGWKVLRFTVLNYKNLLQELNKIYDSRKSNTLSK